MPVKIQKNQSRLTHSTLVSVDGYEFWTRTSIPDIKTTSKDIIHVVEDSDRIDSISDKYYGNEHLWWIIAAANNLMLLPTDLYPGRQIIIPDLDRLRKDGVI